MKLAIFCTVYILGGSFATEEFTCLKNETFMEITGDVVLSIFVDTNYGTECNITSTKSNHEVAIALFVTHILNKIEYIPGVKIGLRIYDTCNDRLSVYRQALVNMIEMSCSEQYDIGLLAPERFMDVLQPLQSLDILPVYTYSPPNLQMVLVDAFVDFISSHYSKIDLIMSSSHLTFDRFFNASKEAGVCIKSDKDLEWRNNDTELVLVALGDYDDVSMWIDEHESNRDEGIKMVWIILPMDNSYIDDLLPEGSFVFKPEQIFLDLSQGLDSADVSQIPVNTIIRSPYLLSIGKSIVEIVKEFQETQTESCPLGALGCIMPRLKTKERRSISNARLFETLRIPANSFLTRYIISQKIDDKMLDITGYKIDATSARFRSLVEKEHKRLPQLCIKKLNKNCNDCLNFQTQEQEETEAPVIPEVEYGTLRPTIWVPIFLTILSCGTLACLLVLAFILYLYFVEDVLEGNPAFTVLLILATILMLQSIVPFCLDERARDAEELNASKIFISTLSFGLAFSVMLTRALFLAFSTSGIFSQHINGYLQSFMLFFMAAVELAISSMYFLLGNSESTRVMHSPLYIALLGYDIFLLITLFIVCCFIGQIRRNYNEGMCFFGTSIGLIVCWAIWLTCFVLMSGEKRDLIVCYGILGTASFIIIGILVPRTYFMCAHLNRERNFVERFEPMDIVPDPRINGNAIQSRQTLYEYVSCGSGDAYQQQHQQPPLVNYYGGRSPMKRYNLRHRTPEPRHTPGYNNYGFRPEMREMDGAYVIPEVNVEDSDVNKIQVHQPVARSVSPLVARESAHYTLSRSKLRKAKSGRQQRNERDNCVETEVYVQDRLCPAPHGPNEHYPRRCSSPKLSPTHATIHEEDEECQHKTRITRF